MPEERPCTSCTTNLKGGRGPGEGSVCLASLKDVCLTSEPEKASGDGIVLGAWRGLGNRGRPEWL